MARKWSFPVQAHNDMDHFEIGHPKDEFEQDMSCRVGNRWVKYLSDSRRTNSHLFAFMGTMTIVSKQFTIMKWGSSPYL